MNDINTIQPTVEKMYLVALKDSGDKLYLDTSFWINELLLANGKTLKNTFSNPCVLFWLELPKHFVVNKKGWNCVYGNETYPQKDEKCIVSTLSNRGRENVKLANFHVNKCEFMCADVIAWMPLPKIKEVQP